MFARFRRALMIAEDAFARRSRLRMLGNLAARDSRRRITYNALRTLYRVAAGSARETEQGGSVWQSAQSCLRFQMMPLRSARPNETASVPHRRTQASTEKNVPRFSDIAKTCDERPIVNAQNNRLRRNGDEQKPDMRTRTAPRAQARYARYVKITAQNLVPGSRKPDEKCSRYGISSSIGGECSPAIWCRERSRAFVWFR